MASARSRGDIGLISESTCVLLNGLAAGILEDAFRLGGPGFIHDSFTLCTVHPDWVPQGMLNATAFFPSTLARVLAGTCPGRCLFWADYLIFWGAL